MLTSPPNNNNVPVWNTGLNSWTFITPSWVSASTNATSIQTIPVSGAAITNSQALITPASGSTLTYTPQFVPIVSSVPSTDKQILQYNLSTNKWDPVSIGGDLAPSNDFPNSNYSNPILTSLQNTPINLTTLTDGDYFGYDATNSQWTNLAVPTIAGTAGGDLTGTYPNPKINKFQGIPVGDITNPANKNILQYNGSQWVLSDLPTALPPNGNAGGDLGSTYPNPTVTGIRNIPINLTTLTDGDYFGYDATNSQWTNFPVPSGLSVGGDVTGSLNNITVIGLQTIPIDSTLPTVNGLKLMYNGTKYTPSTGILQPIVTVTINSDGTITGSNPGIFYTPTSNGYYRVSAYCTYANDVIYPGSIIIGALPIGTPLTAISSFADQIINFSVVSNSSTVQNSSGSVIVYCTNTQNIVYNITPGSISLGNNITTTIKLFIELLA
jgi:hypothetical protein